MKRLGHKTWVRALAFALCCIFVACGALCAGGALHCWNLGWYSGASRAFVDSQLCFAYVSDCTYYVGQNISWLGMDDPVSVRDMIDGYSGEDFACIIYEEGRVLLDTTTDASQPVTQNTEFVHWSEPEAAVVAALEEGVAEGLYDVSVLDGYIGSTCHTYSIDSYINVPCVPYGGCYAEYQYHSFLAAAADWFLPLAGIFLLLAALLLALLLLAAGRGETDAVLRWLGRVPADVCLAVLLLAALLATRNWWDTLVYSNWRLYARANVLTAILDTLFAPAWRGLVWSATMLPLAMTVLGRLRARCLWRSTLLARTPASWRLPCCCGAGAAATLLILPSGGGWMLLFALLFWLLALAETLVMNRQLAKLRRAARELASGNLSYKIDTNRLGGGLSEYGEALNRIGDGLSTAVEERLRGERFKTELITNVSHDLKTPLTSIVSYVDLLKKENNLPESAREYIEVVDRQSAKLRKLTEDLVEASKASSGAIAVHPAWVDVGELLSQSVGEYEERLSAAGVQAVLDLPEGPCRLYTDGRLLWRVLENLIQNMVKYAQPGTRAYFDLTQTDGKTAVVLKNTSAQQLNVPAEALLERFVRGDSSRSTEGSGLGLSIAQSLTELLGGSLRLHLDGDLFKVTLSFEGVSEP